MIYPMDSSIHRLHSGGSSSVWEPVKLTDDGWRKTEERRDY